MPKNPQTPIELFIASGAETADIREKIKLKLDELNDRHKNSAFYFKARGWEGASGAIPPSGRSQDTYSKLIDSCEMVAVIIKNTFGKYSEEEFNYAFDLFKKTGRSPKVVVYTLPSNDDHVSRSTFTAKLKAIEYYPQKVDEQSLYEKIIGELLSIKEELEAEQKSRVVDVAETVSHLHIDSDLTREAVTLFENGDYNSASNVLDIDKLRKRARELTFAQKEMKDLANAFVLKAMLELTDVKNEDRFINAEKLFDEALTISRAPEILFEYAAYCQRLNLNEKALALSAEALFLYQELVTKNPSIYDPEIARVLNNIALVHCNLREYKSAIVKFSEILKIYHELAKTNPTTYLPNVARVQYNLGVVHWENSKYKQWAATARASEVALKKAALRKTAKIDPETSFTSNSEDWSDTKVAYQQAEAEFSEALAIYRQLADENPSAYAPKVESTLDHLAWLHKDYDNYLRKKYGTPRPNKW